jgi:hypothetical protein
MTDPDDPDGDKSELIYAITRRQIQRLRTMGRDETSVLVEVFGKCKSTFMDDHYRCQSYDGHRGHHYQTKPEHWNVYWHDVDSDQTKWGAEGVNP